ncbi:hypothetical protein ColTof4_14318 [Colletotrichum tofieldiae]|nr:hypothetical protein ColTof4_14318 [Colletotrichum tofieldiae]
MLCILGLGGVQPESRSVLKSKIESEAINVSGPKSDLPPLPSLPLPALTSDETRRLLRILRDIIGPSSVGRVAERMGRTWYDVAVKVIQLRQSAEAVAATQGRRVPYFLTKPLASQMGGQRTAVISGDMDRMEMIVYRGDGSMESRKPIPRRFRDQGNVEERTKRKARETAVTR